MIDNLFVKKAEPDAGDATAKKNRKPGVTAKDMQLTYLTLGVDAVHTIVAHGHGTMHTAKRALAALNLAGNAAEDFSAWVANNSNGRGRPPPSVGEVRQYTVQKVKGQAPFIRLPINCIGLDKGDVATVTFGRDCLYVSITPRDGWPGYAQG